MTVIPSGPEASRERHKLEALARQVLPRYGIRRAKMTGLSQRKAASFKIEADNPLLLPGTKEYAANTCLLRIHVPQAIYRHQMPDDPRENITRELAWLEALASARVVAAPRPIMNTAGETVTVLTAEGGRPVCATLMRWVKGEPMTRRPDNAARIGAAMAALHTFALDAASGLPPPATWNPVLPDIAAVDDAPHLNALIDECRPLMQRVIDDVEGFAPVLEAHGTGLIHGDLVEKNCLTHQGETRLIDFAECAHAPLLWDMAKVFGQWLAETAAEGKPQAAMELFKACIETYRTRHAIAADASNALGALTALWLVRSVHWLTRAWPHFETDIRRNVIDRHVPLVMAQLRRYAGGKTLVTVE